MFRKTLLVLALLAVLGGGIFALSRTPKKSTVYGAINAEESVAKAAEILAKDGDSDGLKDWEEELWKTNPEVADTDGDGTGDGDEIKLGRNPLKAPPGDLLDNETVVQKTTTGAAKKQLTLTEQFARELFTEYLTAKRTKGEFTAEDEKKLLLHFFDNPPPLKPLRVFTEVDISVGEETGARALHEYGNALTEALLKYSDASENELLTLKRAIDTETPSELDALKHRKELYEGAIAALTSMPVPQSAVAVHLELLASIAAMKEGVSGMLLLYDDPVQALATIGQYPGGLSRFYDAVSAIGEFLLAKGVVYEKGEAGYDLTTK